MIATQGGTNLIYELKSNVREGVEDQDNTRGARRRGGSTYGISQGWMYIICQGFTTNGQDQVGDIQTIAAFVISR